MRSKAKSCLESRHSPCPGPTWPRPSLRSGLALLVVLLAAGGCGGHSSEKIFLDSVAKPRPSSVTILRAEESTGATVEYWVHFRIAPKDLAALLKADGFVPVPANQIPFDFASLRPPRWWQPKTLGPGLKCYVREDKATEDTLWRKYLYANKDNGEVYFVKFYYY